MRRRLPFLLILAGLLGLLVTGLQAQVVVYELSFSNTGPNVNYSFLQGGYLVVDENASSFSSVVVLNDPVTFQPYYTTGLLSGSYLTMLEEGSNNEVAVIYSMSGGSDSADNIAFQVIGDTDNDTSVGGGASLPIAKKLKGFLLASAAESGTTSTTGNSTFTYGFAGSSKATAKFQSGLTKDANNNRMDAATTVTYLTEVLTNRGIGPEPTPTPSPSPEPSPSPTPAG